jgi:hypothetical protein
MEEGGPVVETEHVWRGVWSGERRELKQFSGGVNHSLIGSMVGKTCADFAGVSPDATGRRVIESNAGSCEGRRHGARRKRCCCRERALQSESEVKFHRLEKTDAVLSVNSGNTRCISFHMSVENVFGRWRFQ